MMFDILIKNAVIVSPENDFVPYRASIGIIKDKISAIIVNNEKNDYSSKKIIDASDRVAFPGLFNNHVHGDMTMVRGLGDNLTLSEQNDLFGVHNWFYDFILDEDRYLSRQLTYAESLLNGVTFVTENMYWGLGLDSIKAMESVGIKGALVEDVRLCFRNPNKFIEEDYLNKLKKECKERGFILVLGSISEEDFKYDYLTEIDNKAKKHDLFITSHLAENNWRVKLIREKFKMSSVEFMEKCSALHEKYLGSHVVKVNYSDLNILKKYSCSVVSTPICEMKIEDGIAPISKMIKKNINVSLGTDGALWNNSNDIFAEMKQTALAQSYKYGVRSISNKDILRMATINGAKAYSLEKEYGSIEIGKKASIILIDSKKISWQPVRENEFENITSNIIFNTNGNDVTDVFVDGKHVVKDKKLVTLNMEELTKQLENTTEKIIKGLMKYKEGKK